MTSRIPSVLGITSVLVACGVTSPVWAACYPTKDFKLAYSDNGQFLGDYVGASTRIECDPSVADPRFIPGIDRRKSGRGAIRENSR